MSDGRACQGCNRSTWADSAGASKPLEVCESSRHGDYRCLTCHFKPTEEEILRYWLPSKGELKQ